MTSTHYLKKEAMAFIKRANGPYEIKILPEPVPENAALCYKLYNSLDENPDCLGCILFDTNGYWMCNGGMLPFLTRNRWTILSSIMHSGSEGCSNKLK